MYHYTECGLDHVWLRNGYHVRKTPYGRAVSVENVDGLHRLLAGKLTKKPGRLSGKEVRYLRNFLGLSQGSLGDMLGVSDQSVSLWERKGQVPKAPDSLLRFVVVAKLDNKTRVGALVDLINDAERQLNGRSRIVVVEEPSGKWVSEPEELLVAA